VQKRFSCRGCSITVTFVIIASNLLAQPAISQPADSITLPQVVVTATRTERSLADQPDSVTVVTRQQIQETPAQSLDDVLRTIPSIDLPLTASYQVHPTANSVSMRGLGGIRALVLLDGVPINDPFFGYIQWNRVPMENVERVEVVRGGGSPLWGNYAMGGVINIITRVPDQKEVGLEAGGGNYGTYRSNSYGDLVLSDSLKARINVNGWGTAGFLQVPRDAGPIYVPTSFGAVNTQLSTYFTPDPSLRGYLRLNYHYNDQILLTPLSDNNQRIYDFAGSATKSFGPSELTLTAFHENSRFITDNTNTPDGVATGFGEFLQNLHTTPVQMTGASGQWSMRVNDTFRLLSVGSDFQQIHGTDSAAIFDETGAQLRTDVGGGSQRFIGVFGEADVFPIPEFEILGSVRYQNFFNYDGIDTLVGGPVPNSSANSVNPRLSLRYRVTPSFALRAAGYSSFRAPNLDNLYRSFSVPFGVFEPNSQLKPEKLKGGEAGIDVNWGPVSGQLTGYVTRITNLITSRDLGPDELPAGFSFGTRNINAGKAKANGFEAAINWSISDEWKANFGYTYALSRIVDNPFDPASVGKQIAGIPVNYATWGLAYADPRGWRASTRLRLVGKSWGDNDHTFPIGLNFVVDGYLAYSVTRSIEAFLEFQNLLNRRYVADNSGFNPPLFGTPLTAFAGVRVKFN
jgi:outer membrane receptor protein involved in Fe transport